MSDVELRGLHKSFGSVDAVRDCSLNVAHGEFVAILGPSGCGKTTLLRLISGFLSPDRGSIMVGGRDVAKLPPFQRNIGFVFQSYALFPHLTVEQNLAFGLKMRGTYKTLGAERIRQCLEMVRLTGMESRMPHQLSGGQQQRVALARALVIGPDLLLLDEPLGALDRKLREAMQMELRALQRNVGITTLFVTHDQDEALTMADRIVVMNGGKVEQVGAPGEIYEAPRTRFIADFIGVSNFFTGTLGPGLNGHMTLRAGDLAFAVKLDTPPAALADRTFMVRPEKVVVRADPPPAAPSNHFEATITDVVYQGNFTRLRVARGPVEIIAMVTNHEGAGDALRVKAGQSIYLSIDPANFRLID